MPEKTERFEALCDGWVAGRFCRAGETVELTPAAAKYETGLRRLKPAKRPAERPSKGD